MDISTTQQPQANGQAGQNQNQNTQATGQEFDNFIRLLTAQVRNQDPMAPMDSTQFVEQLATFSNLEQQVQSNQSLTQIATMMSDLFAIIASDWIGETVSVESVYVPFDGNDVNFEFTAPEQADRAVLQVYDNDGNLLDSDTLDLGQSSWNWNGVGANGDEIAAGSLLQMRIEIYNADNVLLGSLAPRLISNVTDVAVENGRLRLITDDKFGVYASQAKRL
jgi:flagellar basal-body rod modification protein FlgD